MLLIGALLGLAAAVGLCWLTYQLGYHLDYRLFFRVMGTLLVVFAAGLLADAIQNLQELGWLTLGTASLWNTGSLLSEASAIGDILHTFLGYAQAPTVLQVFVYVTYLSLAGKLFWRLTRKPPAASSSSTRA